MRKKSVYNKRIENIVNMYWGYNQMQTLYIIQTPNYDLDR